MAALNSTETEDLRKIQSLLDTILREGYRPEHVDGPSITNDPVSKQLKPLIQKASKSISTLVQMKGYYPK